MKTHKGLTFGCIFLALLFNSCSKDDEIVIEPSSIELITGNTQTATVETALTNPIEILIKGQNGNPFAGTTVNFLVSEGAVSATTATTNANGIVAASWTLGASVGTQILTVTGFKADGTTPLTNSPLSVTATATAAPLEIGDFYEGGIIFYLDNTGTSGLVCAVLDHTSEVEWGCTGTSITGAGGIVIGFGSQNTQDIEANCTTFGTAADIATNATLNSFNDWFLPSKDELNEMFLNKTIVDTGAIANGGFAFTESLFYWSSTENSSSTAWMQGFLSGFQNTENKDVNRAVRFIREF